MGSSPSPARRAFELAGLTFVLVIVFPLLAGRPFRLSGSVSPLVGWLALALPVAAVVFVVVFALSYSWTVWQDRRTKQTEDP